MSCFLSTRSIIWAAAQGFELLWEICFYNMLVCTPHAMLYIKWIKLPLLPNGIIHKSSCISTGVTILSTGAAVGIPIAVFLVSFLIGAMLVVLITYCCVRRRKKSSGQLQPSYPQPEPLQPSYSQSELPHEYCEVEIKCVDTLELKENVAYGPVRH